MTQLKMLSADDKISEIRRLYFNTSQRTIDTDLAKALDLLKSMASEEERERATVYMEGLAEMRKDWVRERATPAARGGPKKPARPPSSQQKGARTRASARRTPPKPAKAKADKGR
jgi:hypothetical protein